MSRHFDGSGPNHFSQSFIWANNRIAYEAVRCEACKASGRDLECESCVNTGIDPIPVSEVMSVR